jgi:hypothetical protein
MREHRAVIPPSIATLAAKSILPAVRLRPEDNVRLPRTKSITARQTSVRKIELRHGARLRE